MVSFPLEEFSTISDGGKKEKKELTRDPTGLPQMLGC